MDVLNLWGRFRDYVTAGLGVALVVTSIGWYVTDLKLDAAVAGREKDRATYEKAQAEYTQKALEEKLQKEKEYNEKQQEADANYSDLLNKYESTLRLYKESQRKIGGYNLPGYPSSPEVSDGQSSGPQLPTAEYALDRRVLERVPSDQIMIPFVDAQICAINTARVKATKEWYDSLTK